MTKEAGRALAVLCAVTMALASPPRLFGSEAGPGSVLPDDVRYTVTFNKETAATRTIRVEMTFTVASPGEVALSIPAWTPGSYELDNFARHVRDFGARNGESEIRWDKADYDTWRVYPHSAGEVSVSFDYRADTMDVGMAWSTDGFAFFNGTNLFPFFEGQDLGFPSRVTFHTEPDWDVITGLTPAGTPLEYRADGYHELVDMPTFVGEFEADTREFGGHTYRLATYPRGVMSPRNRALIWDQIERMMPPMMAVFGEIPWDTYTTLMVFDPTYGGGSALEHSNSHLGTYANGFMGTAILASITAHEIFHAWNVKRLRPAQLWPYDYARAQPTELLWISEGITDYYADLALIRGDIIYPEGFYQLTTGKIQSVDALPPTALEDASLSTWIDPDDGTGYLYYDKGSLAGFALDILIRDDTDNRSSLDDVLRSLYRDRYLAGEGFTEDDWWEAVAAVAPGVDRDAFHDRYVDGRVPFAWNEILPMAGMALIADTTKVPRIGVTTQTDSTGVLVVSVGPGSAADEAGVEPGDRIVSVGDVQAVDGTYGARFRARYGADPEGSPLPLVVEREGQRLDLSLTLRFAEDITVRMGEAEGAGEKARRIREGILTGRVDP